MWVKSSIAVIIKYIMVFIFAKRNGIQTRSTAISTKAMYGKGIRIGKNVIIDDDALIGDFTYVNQNSSIECCTIGKFCSISEGVKINPIEHNSELVSTHPFVGDNGHYGLKRNKVTIGNDVLISVNAIILSGVNVGNGAIIGAGAVVTHDVLPYEVVGGVPARHIKYRFDSAKIKFIEGLCWWDWTRDKLQRNLPFFRNEVTHIED